MRPRPRLKSLWLSLAVERAPHRTHRESNLRVPNRDGLFHKVDAERLDIVLAVRCEHTNLDSSTPATARSPTYSKLPSTYFTISDVLPICASPTMPTLRTMLASKRTVTLVRVPGAWGAGRRAGATAKTRIHAPVPTLALSPPNLILTHCGHRPRCPTHGRSRTRTTRILRYRPW
jgi:hypothetical protein